MKFFDNFWIGFVLLATILCSSCSKYLDKIPANNVATPESLEDLQAMLDDADLMNKFSTPALGEVAADDYFLTKAQYDARPEFYKKSYTWQPYEYTAPNDWSQAYAPIYVSNFCIEYLNKIPLTDQNRDSWNNVQGSAYFFRAYYFLNLTWTYGKAYDADSSKTDLGIVLRHTSDFNATSVRASVAESYQQVVDDIRQAIPYLPELPAHPMRPSRCAAYGLMARTYLSMREYDSAYKYADLCLHTKNDLLDYNSSSVSPNAFIPFQPFNNEIIFFTTMNGNPNVSRFTANIDTVLLASYDGEDLRKQIFFQPSGNFSRFKGSYDVSANSFSGLAVDEQYLIRSECLARSNKIQESRDDLDNLLLYRYATGQYSAPDIESKEQLLNKILLERRKELLMRGIRWSDIKRLNKENVNIVPKRVVDSETFTILPNSNRYALPLPKDIIDITGMPQNPS